MTAPRPRSRQPKQLDAGRFQAEISSSRLHLAAEGKAARTVRTYTEAVQWFAAAHLLEETGHAGWGQVDGHDVQRWMAWLLGRYSSAYASNQYRALQQFFKWLAAEEELPDPVAGCARRRLPRSWSRCSPPGSCRGSSGRAPGGRSRTGVTPRSSRCSGPPASACPSSPESGTTPGDPRRSDVDVWQREITVRGKGGKARIVKITYDAARTLDRYSRVRDRHGQAWRPQLWLGVNGRGR